MVLTLSCKETSYDSDDIQSTSVIKNLNKQNVDEVIAELEGKPNISSEETYYLASAYAIKGGMDIYAIYPIMEIELFHKRALDWDELDETKNPYKKFLREKKEKEVSAEEKKEAWDRYQAQFINQKKIQELDCFKYKEYSDFCFEQKEGFVQLYKRLENQEFLIVEDGEYLNPYDKERYAQEVYQYTINKYNNYGNYETDYDSEFYIEDESGSQYHPSYPKQHIISELESYYLKKIELMRQKQIFMLGKDDNEQNSSIKMMNFFWGIYESIPVIQRLPIITHAEQKTLGKTLEILFDNLKQDIHHTKSAKMIVMILTFSLSSVFADSFELSAITSPMDMGCYLNAEKFLSYHGVLRDRLKFVTKMEEVLGPLANETSQSVSSIKAYLENTSEVLSTEEKDNFYAAREQFEVENCGPNIFLYK